MARILALVHVAFEDLGSLGDELAGRGHEVLVVDVCTADLGSLDFLSPDLLVVMGGPIGAYDAEAYPFLRRELAGLTRRLGKGAPTLGICLGAQLMAAALGTAVHPGSGGKEIGWSVLEQGRDTAECAPMAELLFPAIPVLHWHGDTFDLPRGAAHLAATDQYANQAWSLGPGILGLQFHPEVKAGSLERWYVGHACELAAAHIDVPRLRSDGQRLAPALYAPARRFWARWLDDALPSTADTEARRA